MTHKEEKLLLSEELMKLHTSHITFEVVNTLCPL